MAERFQVPAGIPAVRPNPNQAGRRTNPQGSTQPQDFSQVLQEKLKPADLKFSAHAQKRLDAAGITLTPEQRSELESAVGRAAAKGSREALVLVDDLAFVVSVKNQTVITCVDGERVKDNVFTQIDSAVIASQKR